MKMFDFNLINRAKIYNDSRAYEQLYLDNLGLFHCIARDMGVEECDLPDFLQICYLALVKTVNTWEDGEYSFLSFLRMNIRSLNFSERLKMKYPVRLNTQNYRRPYYYATNDEYESLLGDVSFDSQIEDAERSVLLYGFWSDVKALLNYREFTVIYQRFVCNDTLQKIGMDLGVSTETVRRAEKSALKKLKCKKIEEKYFYQD